MCLILCCVIQVYAILTPPTPIRWFGMLKQGSVTVAVHEETLMITGTECKHYMLFLFGEWHALGVFLAHKN